MKLYVKIMLRFEVQQVKPCKVINFENKPLEIMVEMLGLYKSIFRMVVLADRKANLLLM